ncbi:RDD family protein [Actinomadura sp. NPDC047616]|uniref:RDD family protein n=1 Tax=Actinomadura sp. NPDC047616 TaxID=3155914 RepID=UPI0033E407EB
MAASPPAPGADPLPPAEGESAPELAEPGQRLVARIVDTLVVGLPVVMVIREGFPDLGIEKVAPPLVAGLLLVYEWIQLALWGRTVGKRVAGIEVVREDPGCPAVDRRRPDVLRSLLRAATYCLPIAVRPVPVFGAVAGLFWVANAGAIYESRLERSARRRALHDRFAGTVVVRRPAAVAAAADAQEA